MIYFKYIIFIIFLEILLYIVYRHYSAPSLEIFKEKLKKNLKTGDIKRVYIFLSFNKKFINYYKYEIIQFTIKHKSKFLLNFLIDSKYNTINLLEIDIINLINKYLRKNEWDNILFLINNIDEHEINIYTKYHIIENYLLNKNLDITKKLDNKHPYIFKYYHKILLLAIYHKNLDLVKYLIKSGVDVFENNNQALIVSVEFNCFDISLFIAFQYNSLTEVSQIVDIHKVFKYSI